MTTCHKACKKCGATVPVKDTAVCSWNWFPVCLSCIRGRKPRSIPRVRKPFQASMADPLYKQIKPNVYRYDSVESFRSRASYSYRAESDTGMEVSLRLNRSTRYTE